MIGGNMASNDNNTIAVKEKDKDKEKKDKRSKGIAKRINKSVSEIRLELKRVTWPTWRELFNYTVTVLVVCAIMGVLIYLLDLGLTQVLKLTLDIGV
jgi:preprotein translocase subunit SecE